MREVAHAQKVLLELAEKDAWEALEELTFWLKSINECADLEIGKRLALLTFLEAGAQPYYRKAFDASGWLLPGGKPDARSWWLVCSFWEVVALNYTHCIEQSEKNTSANGAIPQDASLWLTRALNALGEQARMHYRANRPISSRLWRAVHRLHSIAERRQLLRVELTLYPMQGKGTSALQEILKILVLHISNPSTLTAVQMEIAFRLLDHCSGLFLIASRLSETTPFIDDLALSIAPSQIMRAEKVQVTTRFFGVGAALQKMTDLQLRSEYGSLPQEFQFLAIHSSPDVHQAASHLLMHWSPKNSQRRHSRTRTEAQILVTQGLPELFSLLALGAKDPIRQIWQQSARSSSTPKVASWILENISDSGFGLILPGQPEPWMKIGTLLGFSFSGSGRWNIGIIRRIGRDTRFRVYVGARILSKTPILASMQLMPESAESIPPPPVSVLLLSPAMIRESTGVEALCNPEALEIGKTYLLDDGENTRPMKFEDLREKGDGFLSIRLIPVL